MLNILRKFGRYTGINRVIMRLFARNYEQYFDDALKSNIGQSDVVFDVGANVGFYTKSFARLSKKVFAIEPDPSTVEILKNNLVAEKVDENVEIVNKALGSENGSLKFMSDRPGHVTNGIHKNGNMEVEVITLDSLCKETGVWPDVVKIDVEGYEYEVLKGSYEALKNARVIGIEVHAAILESRGLKRPLKAIKKALVLADFEVRVIDPSHVMGFKK